MVMLMMRSVSTLVSIGFTNSASETQDHGPMALPVRGMVLSKR